jgi:hypothetical protein
MEQKRAVGAKDHRRLPLVVLAGWVGNDDLFADTRAVLSKELPAHVEFGH